MEKGGILWHAYSLNYFPPSSRRTSMSIWPGLVDVPRRTDALWATGGQPNRTDDWLQEQHQINQIWYIQFYWHTKHKNRDDTTQCCCVQSASICNVNVGVCANTFSSSSARLRSLGWRVLELDPLLSEHLPLLLVCFIPFPLLVTDWPLRIVSLIRFISTV